MKNDIFISYCRKNLQEVISIRDDIKEQLGVSSWIDLKGIESGEQFANIIINAIDECKVVLFMISEASMQSDYTKKEVMYARNVGKKVVPVVLDGSKLSGWFLFEFGLVDAIDIRDSMQKQKFYDNIRGWLGLADTDEGPIDFFDTGLHYYLKKEYNVALKWLKKAASYGYPDAMFYIGLCYHYGYGVTSDHAKAMEWYQKASDQNYAESQNNIGLLYKHGLGVEKNEEIALEWFRKARDNGSQEGEYNIAKCYYYGRGIALDLEKAAKGFEKLALQGHVKSQAFIAYCYFRGEGVPQDYKKTVEWLSKAPDNEKTPVAKYYLGYCYYYGLGVGQDYRKAVYWFEENTRNNHAASEFYLGLCYKNGLGVAQDEKTARNCFRKALKQGICEAEQYLR